ncbi:MAG: glycosyltransferase family 2 protein [Myxococcota bacterium]|nr:glycosyltransferase family 2 protein [Myxococcota bacterium]
MKSLSVIFPAFNEVGNIELAVATSDSVLSRLDLEYEIVVVDDGSNDGTREQLEALCEKYARVRAVHHPTNRGYGAALKSGITAARFEHIFFTDADLQFDIEEISRLIRFADRYDVIAGYRQRRSDPWIRRTNAWAWGVLVGGLFDLGVRDVDCAFKIFHRRVFERIPICSVGAFVNTEILVRARAAGFAVHQIPVSHYPRRCGRQTGANPRVVLRAFLELGRLHGELRHAREGAPSWVNRQVNVRPELR